MTWVEYDRRVVPGSQITLKDHDDSEALWDVEAVYQVHDSSDIKRGWNNNI